MQVPDPVGSGFVASLARPIALLGGAAAWPLVARTQRAGQAFHAFGCPSEPWLASWIYEYAPLIDLDPDRLDDGTRRVVASAAVMAITKKWPIALAAEWFRFALWLLPIRPNCDCGRHRAP